VVSICHGQRKPLCWANWVGNVYHGLPKRLSPGDGSGKYLAFLGRICPEKRVDRAIQIALEVGMPLKIAAKVDLVDREYHECKIKPLLVNPNIEYIGEIAEQQKAEFLGDAYAHLFPIDWPEPFGLTMIEAMACGTPTIALMRLRVGIRREREDCNNPLEAVTRSQKFRSESPGARQEFERRFQREDGSGLRKTI
jgi:hypothetical protein